METGTIPDPCESGYCYHMARSSWLQVISLHARFDQYSVEYLRHTISRPLGFSLCNFLLSSILSCDSSWLGYLNFQFLLCNSGSHLSCTQIPPFCVSILNLSQSGKVEQLHCLLFSCHFSIKKLLFNIFYLLLFVSGGWVSIVPVAYHCQWWKYYICLLSEKHCKIDRNLRNF